MPSLTVGGPDPLRGPVLSERRGAVAWLTLNRPDRLNAVNLELYSALIGSIRDAVSDDSVRALVLTGTGRAFCAGADLKAHADSELTPDDRRRYAREAQKPNLLLQRCDKPVIAAVNGPAIGAGLELALSCDFIVVSRSAKLRMPEIALATFVGGGVTYTLQARVGAARAREIIMLGDFFDGEAAAAMGLADRAVDDGDVVRAAGELADRLAAQAPVSMKLAKRLLRRAPHMTRRDAMAAEARALEKCMATEDWREGIAAFAEKRPPRYTGQ